MVVRGQDTNWFLAGDTSYTQSLMLARQVDGIAPDDDEARETLGRIRALAGEMPLVYLPSHDPEAARRLEEGELVPGTTP